MSIYGNPVMLGGGGGGGTGEAFLEAEATTYLNTGVAGNTVYKLRLEFTPITVVNDYQWYIGGANNDLTIASMAKSAGPTSGFIRVGGVDFGVVTFLIGQKNVLVCENGTVTLNGMQLSGTFSGPVNTTSTIITLFGPTSAGQFGHSRVYLCELYDSSDNLIKKLVPHQDSNYIPCMLDVVSNTAIYGNNNNLTFGYVTGSGGGGAYPSAENLLCNWDFANAVNTRGQSSYSGSGVTWATDGWLVYQGSATIATGGIKLARYGSASFALFQQKPVASVVQAMLGKTLTVSAMVDDSFGYQTIEITSANGNQGSTLTVSGIFFYMYRDSVTQMTFNIYTNTANNDNKLIKAVKLEAGSESTLAHQEGGVWVLNENQNNDAQYIFVRGMVNNS